MSNFQSINNDDILDTQQTADISTINTNILNINNKLGGSTSSGLKTLINDNTATITTNQTNISNLNSYPSSDATKMGFISITQNCNLDDIESDTNTNNLKVGITSSQQTKLGNITITSAKNLDTMEANITTNTNTNTSQGTTIANNTTLINNNQTAINTITTTNTAQGSGIVGNQTNIANNLTAINNNTTSITGIKNNTLSSTLKSAVDANSAKLSYPSSLNSLLSVSDTYELEVGNGNGIPRVRLRGANGTAISSELIFIDAIQNNAEYYQGAVLRFNSVNNRLEFLTDQGNDNNAELAMYIQRTSTPQTYINFCYVYGNFYLFNVSQSPRNSFFYARRIKLVGSSTTPSQFNVPTGVSNIIWSNNIINGALSYNTTTGILTTSTTGLFKIKAKICMTTTSAERVAKIGLKVNGGVDVIIGKNHLSKHDSNNSSFSAPEIDGNVRLQSGISYIFWIECLSGSTGIIMNQPYENNDLCIEGLVLPNGYSLPTNYSPV